MKRDFLEAGRILNVHGIGGEVKFEHWCDSPAVLRKVKRFFFDDRGEVSVSLCGLRQHGKFLLLKLEGINDPETARQYKNRVLYARREDLAVEKGRVFISDLIGLPLIEEETGRIVGTVKDVVNRGASDLYVVDLGGREEYFPAVKEFIRRIDVETGIYVTVPLGLFDKAEA